MKLIWWSDLDCLIRHDVEMLNGALAQARQDNQVLDRKEAEAVDQVRRSVEVAEQMRLER